MTDPAIQPDAWDERRAFIESRRTGLGATDAAVLLGLHPWKNRLQLYHDKVDPPVLAEPSLPAWLGLKLEDTVAELYATQEGVELRNDNRHHRHPDHEFLVTHLDRRVVGQPKRLVELKTTSRAAGWGEQYSADVPIWHWCQAQHEMVVVGADVCDFAVLFGHYRFRVYRVPRDEVFLARYVVAAADFWMNNVLARVEPPVDGSEYARRLMASRYPDHDDELKPATAEQAAVVEQLHVALQNLAQVEGRVAELKNMVRDIIGAAQGISGPFGVITYKRTRDSTKTDWSLIATAFRNALVALVPLVPKVRLRRLEQTKGVTVTDNALDTLMGLYVTVEPGTRRFGFKWKGEEE